MPYISIEALLQISLVKDYIVAYQEFLPTLIFRTIAVLAKGIEILAYKMTLLTAEVRTLQTVNETLSKRHRAKNTRVQQGGVLTIEEEVIY